MITFSVCQNEFDKSRLHVYLQDINTDSSNYDDTKHYGCLIFINENKKEEVVCKFDICSEIYLTMEKSGRYYVKLSKSVNGESYLKKSQTIIYLGDDKISEYKSFISDVSSKSSNLITNEVEFFKIPNTPNNNFCLINVEAQKYITNASLNEFCEKCKFDNKIINENMILYDKSDLQLWHNNLNNSIFSGYMWHKEKFYYGSKDISNDINFSTLDNELGCYSVLSHENSVIKITSDYHGFNRCYYYKDNNIVIVSNNYHLLLKVLHNSSVTLEFDDSVLETTLTYNSTLFRQPISHKLLVKNTYIMNSFEEIIINSNNIVDIVYKKNKDVFDENTSWNEKLYKNLIIESKNQIISNAKAVYNHPQFNHIVCEISGGKDSRVVLSALTHITDKKNKICLHTRANDPDVNDKITAMSVANEVDFPYQNFETTMKITQDIFKFIENQRSINMGNKFLWSVESKVSNDDKIMALNGECAEAFWVRYYSALFDGNVEHSNEDELIEDYIDNILHKTQMIYSNDNKKVIFDEIKYVLNNTPGEAFMEKFDNLFYLYRLPPTIGNHDRFYFNFASCMLIQTKTLFLAKRLWINNFKTNKVIFDITRELHPVLAQMNYNSDKLNSERKTMEKHSIWSEDDINKINLPVYNYTTKKWDDHKIKVNVENPNNLKSNYSSEKIHEILKDNLFYNLYKFSTLNNGKYFDMSMQLVHNAMENITDHVHIRVLHHKLTSIMDISLLIMK